jgi:hypothetical protein
VIGLGYQYGSSRTITRIRAAIKAGSLGYKEMILRGVQRLDTIAGEEYGEGRYWWVIAAASDIGWGMQVPAGTALKIPNLTDALALIG